MSKKSKQPSCQYSLFDMRDMIKKPKIPKITNKTTYIIDGKTVYNYEIENMLLKKEKELLGIIVSKDIYEEFALKESIYCNSHIEEVFYCTTNRQSFTFLAEVKDYSANHEKQYAKVELERGGFTLKGMLFKDEFSRYFGFLNKRDIFICQGLFDVKYNSITIKKIKPIKLLNIYPQKVAIEVNNNYFRTMNYMMSNMWVENGADLEIIYGQETICEKFKVALTNKNYIDLLNLKCKVYVEQ